MKQVWRKLTRNLTIYYVGPPERFWYFAVQFNREYQLYGVRIFRWIFDFSPPKHTYSSTSLNVR